MLSVEDKTGCKDEATCGGCCKPATQTLQGWFCGTCQSGWAQSQKSVSWSWGWRKCSVTCSGCEGTLSGDYGHAAARGADGAGDNDDSSAARIIAAVCALFGAGAALFVVRRRRQARLESAAMEAEEPLTLCIGEKAEIDI